jgi:hypothetical protein
MHKEVAAYCLPCHKKVFMKLSKMKLAYGALLTAVVGLLFLQANSTTTTANHNNAFKK